MEEIEDVDLLYRHIPGGSRWQAEGPVLTTANFDVRKKLGETGLSVTQAHITGPEQLLNFARRTPGSRVAAARAGDIRALGLLVIPVPLAHDPGHAEIRDGAASLNQRLVQKRLANLFRFLDAPAESEDE